MATLRPEIGGVRTGWRRVSIVELSLAVCVIAGLLFVSMRITSMEFPRAGGQVGTIVIQTDIPPPAQEGKSP
jgi:hypothetical protein